MKSQESQVSENAEADAAGHDYGNVEETKMPVTSYLNPDLDDDQYHGVTPSPQMMQPQFERADEISNRPAVLTSKAIVSPQYSNVQIVSNKSIDTLPLQLIAKRSEISGTKQNLVQMMNRTTQNGTNMQIFPPKDSLQDNEKDGSESRDDIDHKYQLLTNSVEVARFKDRNTKRKKVSSRSPYGQLRSTLKQSEGFPTESSPNTTSRDRYDMAIGIKATNLDHQQTDVDAKHMRKTVTIFTQQSYEKSQASEDPRGDLLDESVQTDSQGASPVKTKDRIEKTPQLAPAIIKLSGDNAKLTDEESFDGIALETLFIGTPLNRERAKHTGRITSVNDNPSVAVIDQLAGKSNGEEQEVEENAHLSMLRKVLLQAMKMSKTSSDKTWNQMTPFERAKIKQSFQELLKDMSKNERRAGLNELIVSVASVPIGAAPSQGLIQELNSCLSSSPIKKEQRPLQNSPMFSMNTRVAASRINQDLLLAPAMATFGHTNSTRFEHFIFIDENLKVQSPRKVSLRNGSQLLNDHNKTSQGVSAWGGQRSSTRTPKFHDSPSSVNQSKKFNVKTRGISQNISKQSTQRKIIIKSQATATDLKTRLISKPKSAARKNYDDEQDSEQHQFKLEIPNASRIANPPTIMRTTPHSPGDHYNKNEIASDKNLNSQSSNLKVATNKMYHTGGPGLFSTEQGDNDGKASYLGQPMTVESAQNTGDNEISDHRLLVPDNCLNSTLQTYKVDITKDLVVDASVANAVLPSDTFKAPIAENQGTFNEDEEDFEGFTVPEQPQPVQEPLVSSPATTIVMPATMRTDLAKVVKQIKSGIPGSLRVSPPQEQPDAIVLDTLQAISLTKQAREQASIELMRPILVTPQSAFIANSDIAGIKLVQAKGNTKNSKSPTKSAKDQVLDGKKKQFLVGKAYLDSVINQTVSVDVNPIIEKTSENVTSALPNEGGHRSYMDSTKLSGALAHTDQNKSQKFNMLMQKSSGNIDSIAHHVLKSPTQKDLGPFNQISSPNFFKKPALSKYASPTAAHSKGMIRIDSTTEKSSIYPPHMTMISKLGSGSLNPAGDPSIKNKNNSIQINSNLDLGVNLNEASYKNLEVIVPKKQQIDTTKFDNKMVIDEVNTPKIADEYLSMIASKSKLQNKPQNNNDPSGLNNKTRKKRVVKGSLARNSNTITGWEQTQNSSSIEMLVTNQKQTPFKDASGSQAAMIPHAGSTDAKLRILESRMAEHNIENLQIVPLGKNTNAGTTSTTTNAQALHKIQFSQLMTHAALRRSDLKNRAINNSNNEQAAKNSAQVFGEIETQAKIYNLKIGGIKKDLYNFQQKNIQNHQLDNQSRMTAKVVETEKGDQTDTSIIGGGGSPRSPQALRQAATIGFPARQLQEKAMIPLAQNSSENNLSVGYRSNIKMVEIKPQNLEAEDMIKLADSATPKQHGSSVSKLIPSSPSKRMSKVKLESSTSNPSITVAKHNLMKAGFSQANSLYKVNMMAESHQSSLRSPYMAHGTQAIAATPSKVSESSNYASMKQGVGVSAQAQKRKPIENIGNLQKLNQTQQDGSFCEIDKKKMDETEFYQAQVVNLKANQAFITGSEENTDNGGADEMPMRATLNVDANTRTSIIQMLENEENSEEKEDKPVNQADLQQVAEITFGKARQVKKKKHQFTETSEAEFAYHLLGKTIGNRSQSLAPPVLQIEKGETAIDKIEHFSRQASALKMQKKSTSSQHKVKVRNIKKLPAELAIFSNEISQAPHQKLPTMQNLTIIEGAGAPQVGKKKDLRTPLHKLLTSDQMEEFQSLLGSKTYKRKQARLRGHLFVSPTADKSNSPDSPEFPQHSEENTPYQFSSDIKSMLKTQTSAFDKSQQAGRLTQRAAQISPRGGQQQHLPYLKFPPFNQTILSDFAKTNFSKHNTIEHVKRVKQIQASTDNRVIFIDPLTLGGKTNSNRKTMQPMSPEMNSTQQQQKQQQQMLSPQQKEHKKMLATNISKKSRASPFQASGPFSFTNPKSTAASGGQLKLNTEASSHDQQLKQPLSKSRDQQQRMPQVSLRYRSTKQRNSSNITETFIFNDINNLASDLRKNSVLVKPIFQSLQ